MASKKRPVDLSSMVTGAMSGDPAPPPPEPGETAPDDLKTKVSSRGKQPYSFTLPFELVDKLRDVVFWTPGANMSNLAEEALNDLIKRMEAERGEPFPRRTSKIGTGRPIGG